MLQTIFVFVATWLELRRIRKEELQQQREES